jgi:type VI secretion system protein ImpH
MTVTEQLFAEGFAFDFFQAVRLLGRVDPRRRPVGVTAAPRDEIVRFRAWLSLNFPSSRGIYEIQRVSDGPPQMTETFMGLTGTQGVLPRHYTELLLRLDREVRGPERYALRAWLDLFNHRFVSLFYRAWEKYRFFLAQERGEHFGKEPDTFTQALYSFVGLGLPALRERLRVAHIVTIDELSTVDEPLGLPRRGEQTLAAIDDLALFYYGGLLSQRPRSAVALRALLADYFELPIEVRQFHGRWLRLEADNQTRLGEANAALGLNVVAGERVWDVQGMIRLRVGPLRRDQFDAFLPDRSPIRERKAFFLLCHLARLYVGPELDFDVQLVLRAQDVPPCQLADDGGLGPRLGWNTWLGSQPRTRDADDAVFPGEEVVLV